MASVREELIDRLVDEYDIQRQDAARAVDLVLEDEENTRYENSDFNIALNEDIEEAADWIYNQNKYWKHLNP